MVDRAISSNGSDMTPEMTRFITGQSMVYAASLDAEGQPSASVIFGSPGFVACDDARHLFINPGESSFSDLSVHIGPGSNAGLFFIEPATRRRARLDGSIEVISEGRLRFSLHRSLRTFPKYIHSREVRWVGFDPAGTSARSSGTQLTEAQRNWIAKSDTFFMASSDGKETPDISHRAGRPGFVRFISESEILFSDYPGDNLDLTPRNLLRDPRAGLLFLECSREGTLHVSGTAVRRDDLPSRDLFDGDFPVMHFKINGWTQRRAKLPVELNLLHYSPFDPHPRR